MGLLDFNKPKWRHKNAETRRAAIELIDPAETEILISLAREDEDQGVRRAAVGRIASIEVLEKLEKQNNSAADLAVIADRKEALLLERILYSKDHTPSEQDIAKIRSSARLTEIAVRAELTENRLTAIKQIDDQQLLAQIIEQNCGKEPAKKALEKIDREELLAKLSHKAAGKTARRLAAEKIAAIELRRQQPSPTEIRDKTLSGLAAEAEKLLAAGNLDEAADRLSGIRDEWQQLDSAGLHPNYSGFCKTCSSFDDKYEQIRENRQAEQAKAAKYAEQQARLNEICTTIERLTGSTANEASSLQQKAAAEWDYLLKDPAERVVPSATMKKRFEQTCRSFLKTHGKITGERKIVSAIEYKGQESAGLVSAGNLKKAGALLAETEKELAGSKLKYFSPAPLAQMLAAAGKSLAEAEEQARNLNISRREAICSELEKLAESEKINKAESQANRLQEQWRQLPSLNAPEAENLAQRFQQAVDNFTRKRKAFDHDQDWQLWANLGMKEKLVAKVEALNREKDLETVVNTVKESQIAWKDIGPLPRKVSQQLWERFHNACDRNFVRSEPYLQELKDKRAAAMVRRKEICVLAEELAASTEWHKTAQALKKLQEEWKILLHGSRREEDKLYKRFREACNRFFEHRHENYELNEAERRQNLGKKEKLCEEAEQLAESQQPENSAKFRTLQARWKTIGHVPKDQEKEIWERFRTACDKYFNWLDEQRQDNLKQKENLCAELEKFLTDTTEDKSPQEISSRIAELQQQWQEIGPVPRDQQDVVWKRFNTPCEEFFKARRKQLAEEEEQRQQNQDQMEEILRKAESLACQGTDKKITGQLQELQKEWQQLGPAPKDINHELNSRFTSLCDAFFAGHRQYFTDLENQRLENQKKKESLCLRLENILGTAAESVAKGQDKALSLAEELKQAMQDNFMLAGRRDEKKSVRDEVKRIQLEWKKTGPSLREHEKKLNQRFRHGIDTFYNKTAEDNSSDKEKQKRR